MDLELPVFATLDDAHCGVELAWSIDSEWVRYEVRRGLLADGIHVIEMDEDGAVVSVPQNCADVSDGEVAVSIADAIYGFSFPHLDMRNGTDFELVSRVDISKHFFRLEPSEVPDWDDLWDDYVTAGRPSCAGTFDFSELSPERAEFATVSAHYSGEINLFPIHDVMLSGNELRVKFRRECDEISEGDFLPVLFHYLRVPSDSVTWSSD